MFEDLENTLKDIRSELSLYRQLFALSMTTLSTKKQVAKIFGCIYINSIKVYRRWSFCRGSTLFL